MLTRVVADFVCPQAPATLVHNTNSRLIAIGYIYVLIERDPICIFVYMYIYHDETTTDTNNSTTSRPRDGGKDWEFAYLLFVCI